MKVFKILISVVIVLAILVFLIAPPVIGLWVKSKYSNLVANLNKKSPNITATISNYRFGWFSSKAMIRIDLHTEQFNSQKQNQKTPSKSNNIRLNGTLDIHHGPIVYVSREGKKHFYFALADIKGEMSTLNLTTNTLWRFGGTLISQFSSPSFKILQNDISVILENLKGTSRYNINTHKLELHFTVKSFEISNLIRINNLTYTNNTDRKGYIRYGSQNLNVDHITFNLSDTNTDTNAIELNALSAQSKTFLKNEKVNMAVQYNIGSISKNPMGINSVQVNFTIQDLNAKSLNTLFTRLQNQEEKNNMAQNYASLAKPGMSLLRHGLTIQVSTFLLKTDEGNVSLNGTFTIPKLNENTTLLQLPSAIKADFLFQAPKNWLQQQIAWFVNAAQHPNQPNQKDPSTVAADTLQQWENQQLLILSDNMYKARIQFENGNLLINGKTPSIKKDMPPATMNNTQSDGSSDQSKTPQSQTPEDIITPLDPAFTPNRIGPDQNTKNQNTPNQTNPSDQNTPNQTSPSDQKISNPTDSNQNNTSNQTTPNNQIPPANEPISPDNPLLKEIPPTEPVARDMPEKTEDVPKDQKLPDETKPVNPNDPLLKEIPPTEPVDYGLPQPPGTTAL